jgi:CubicO group peptidase (beta-lactamase class C family)
LGDVKKSWNRLDVWLGLIVLGAGGVILAVAGLWIYVSATAVPLHPSAAEVASVARETPGTKWTAAVERARQIMRAGVAEQNLPGVSVAVGAGAGIVWAEGFGWADLDTKTPVGPQTQFRIGTASIPLTAAAVGLLLERGKLKLDDDIRTYVPEFPDKPWPVSLRHLMGHTAGIGSDSGDEGPLFSQTCSRPVEALPFFAERDLQFEPGTQYRYSRYGFIVVSAAIEDAAGEAFLTFIRKHVFDPLGMDDTAADSDEPNPDRSSFYFPRFAADTRYGPDSMRPLDYSCYSGSSVFLSTPSDLVRFGLAINGGKLLKPETVQLLHTSQRLASGEETGYGLGWDVEDETLLGTPTRVVGHDGDSLGGVVSSLVTVPEAGIVVAITSNISYADTYSLALKLAEVFAQP